VPLAPARRRGLQSRRRGVRLVAAFSADAVARRSGSAAADDPESPLRVTHEATPTGALVGELGAGGGGA
jgi:hypothetical protein